MDVYRIRDLFRNAASALIPRAAGYGQDLNLVRILTSLSGDGPFYQSQFDESVYTSMRSLLKVLSNKIPVAREEAENDRDIIKGLIIGFLFYLEKNYREANNLTGNQARDQLAETIRKIRSKINADLRVMEKLGCGQKPVRIWYDKECQVLIGTGIDISCPRLENSLFGTLIAEMNRQIGEVYLLLAFGKNPTQERTLELRHRDDIYEYYHYLPVSDQI